MRTKDFDLWGFSVHPWQLAVVTCCVASLISVVGFVLQKKALNADDSRDKRWFRIGDIVLSPTWLVGFLLASVAPIPGDLVAYALAPLSLTAPLSGVTVVLNTVLAPALLGERLQPWPDFLATGLILLGTIASTSAGARREVDGADSADLNTLLYHCADRTFVAALILLGAVLAGCFAYMHRHGRAIELDAVRRPANPPLEDVALPALCAAGTGCLTNIWLKVLGELLKADAPWHECLCCLCLGVLPFALLQLLFVNRGLRLYLQTIFFPIYNAVLVLFNTIYGALFFHEYNELLAEPARLSLFCAGVALVVTGIVTFRLRKADRGSSQCPSPNNAEDDKRRTLLLHDVDCLDICANSTPALGDEHVQEIVGADTAARVSLKAVSPQPSLRDGAGTTDGSRTASETDSSPRAPSPQFPCAWRCAESALPGSAGSGSGTSTPVKLPKSYRPPAPALSAAAHQGEPAGRSLWARKGGVGCLAEASVQDMQIPGQLAV